MDMEDRIIVKGTNILIVRYFGLEIHLYNENWKNLLERKAKEFRHFQDFFFHCNY